MPVGPDRVGYRFLTAVKQVFEVIDRNLADELPGREEYAVPINGTLGQLLIDRTEACAAIRQAYLNKGWASVAFDHAGGSTPPCTITLVAKKKD